MLKLLLFWKKKTPQLKSVPFCLNITSCTERYMVFLSPPSPFITSLTRLLPHITADTVQSGSRTTCFFLKVWGTACSAAFPHITPGTTPLTAQACTICGQQKGSGSQEHRNKIGQGTQERILPYVVVVGSNRQHDISHFVLKTDLHMKWSVSKVKPAYLYAHTINSTTLNIFKIFGDMMSLVRAI